MSVGQAAAILVATHGDAQAQRQAWQGQQNARRARSRKRFSFWLEVESEIKRLVSLPLNDSEGAQPPLALAAKPKRARAPKAAAVAPSEKSDFSERKMPTPPLR